MPSDAISTVKSNILHLNLPAAINVNERSDKEPTGPSHPLDTKKKRPRDVDNSADYSANSV